MVEHEERISELESALKQEQKKRESQQKITNAVRHDMGTLEGALGLLNLEKWTERTEGKRDMIIPIVYKSIEKALSAKNLLWLPEMSKEKLYKSSEDIDVMGIARLHASSVDYHLEKNKIALQIKSAEKMGRPLCIYAHEAAMGLVFGNILGGFANHALSESLAKIEIEEIEGIFRVRGENKYIGEERLRDIAGEAEGIGLLYIKDFAKTMGGIMEIYSLPRIGSRPLCANSGYRGELKDHQGAKTFGIEVRIPSKSLTEKK